jgi:hypothetical protein
MLGARLGGGFRPESLEPLAVIATDLALSFLYEGLSARPDDPARDLTRRFFASAMAALPALRLARGSELVTPFAGRIDRG